MIIFSLTFSFRPSMPPSIASISALVLLFGLMVVLSIESREGSAAMPTITPSCSPLHSPVSSSIRKPSSSFATLFSASLRRCFLSAIPRFCNSGTSVISSGVTRWEDILPTTERRILDGKSSIPLESIRSAKEPLPRAVSP